MLKYLNLFKAVLYCDVNTSVHSPFTKSNLTINNDSIIEIEQQLSFDFGRKIIIS